MSANSIRIYVGADRSQALAVTVLEHSIKRHTKAQVEVIPMLDLGLPQPVDPRQWSRTGFSFSRFAIPRLNGYSGRAIYLDADMQVFTDIQTLWNLPFHGAKIVIHDDIGEYEHAVQKKHAPKRRIKQCSVMLLDCAALSDWVPEEIIAGLDGRYSYHELMSEMCLLEEAEVRYGIPFEWNSLEHYEEGRTCLLHYTDMPTQPWVSPENPFGWVWMQEVRLMLEDGSLHWDQLGEEVRLGYFRPSLLDELRLTANENREHDPMRVAEYLAKDSKAGFVKHREVAERKQQIALAIQEYERNRSRPSAAGLFQRLKRAVSVR